MDAAVVGKSPGRVEFVSELRAAVEYAGIPEPRGVTGSAGGGAMKAGIPIPLNLVADLDRNRRRRKVIAARANTHVKSFGAGRMSDKERKRPSKDGEPSG